MLDETTSVVQVVHVAQELWREVKDANQERRHRGEKREVKTI
jgi:hypothetical protein|tara:strand:- start:84 stop:209 length:126 start_codon:yes stop_codon:yes gene_type:complete